jgi:predicted RNA methylase
MADVIKPVKLGNTRVTGKEQYYTPPQVAQDILKVVVDLVEDFEQKVFLEPAGGTGTFINEALASGFTEVLSYDIEPHHPLVSKGNFLEKKIPHYNCVTVSNPPFGRNNALSIPFFNKAAEYSDLIVFIVPRSWRKWTVQNKLDRRFTLVREDDLNIDYVDASGEPLSKNKYLRTCVQYWKKSDVLRDLVYVKDMGIIERCKYQEADASLTLFGYGCGTVKTEFPKKPNTTQMFLKLKHPRALEALKAVDFSRFFLNTAYTEALSIQEINFLLNEYLFADPMTISQKEKRKRAVL